MFSKEFYQKNTVAVVCDDVHTAVHYEEGCYTEFIVGVLKGYNGMLLLIITLV